MQQLIQRLTVWFLRPYVSLELPGWARLMRTAGVEGFDNVNPKWRSAPTVVTRGKLHGYLMELDLRDDVERNTYFLRRYYDLYIQLLLDKLLMPGDTFIDIGANIGMIALHGASRVTSSGRVIAFEPQRACCDKLFNNLKLNRIGHITVHNVGLSDLDDELVLSIPGGGTIMACFSQHEISGRTVRVPVRRGDDLVGTVCGRAVIKIDVEGYEVHALRGLIKTIQAHRPPVISELNPSYLERAGSDINEAFRFFDDLDYVPYEISVRKNGMFEAPRLGLRRIQTVSDRDGEADLLWLHKDDDVSLGRVNSCFRTI